MTKAKITNAIILAISFIALLMLENFYDEKVTIISSESVTTPDNFFKNGKYIAMNEDGTPSYTVVSPSMKQYFDTETIQLASPKILLFRNKKPPTQIVSGFGRVSYKTKNITVLTYSFSVKITFLYLIKFSINTLRISSNKFSEIFFEKPICI